MRPIPVIAAIIFALMGLGHLYRIVISGSVVALGVEIPMWPSWVLVGVAVVMVGLLLRDAREVPPPPPGT